MDFLKIKRDINKKSVTIYPDFLYRKSDDIIIKGKSFVAIWDEQNNTWSKDEYDVGRLIDEKLFEAKESVSDMSVNLKLMSEYSSKSWANYKQFISSMPDSAVSMDSKIIFADAPVQKKDYSTHRLNYSLEKGVPESYNKMMSVLYSPEELDKIEWAIGSIISGDSKTIEKFFVFFGDGGTGKSTVLNIIQKLFEGYYTIFDAKALTVSNNAFSSEAFRNNPLVAIQHDGDLSRIQDNSLLNSIVSHEEIVMNEKYKSSYSMRINCMLFMATNKAVKITDAKSGLIRRLIDISPTGERIPPNVYEQLYSKIPFELGKIANKCLEKYKKMGKNYYYNYIPVNMIARTDHFYSFVEDNIFLFKEDVTLKQAYELYKQYCEEGNIDYKMPKYLFKEELKEYFNDFYPSKRINDKLVKNVYSGLKEKRFKTSEFCVELDNWIELNTNQSLLDDFCKKCAAQYANGDIPEKKWDNVKTILQDLNTKEVHYVLLPGNHIVLDFDLKDSNGNKSLELNLKAASAYPPTYVEVSKSGCGLHLHYIYSGDPKKLAREIEPGIEIKTFGGKAALRRRVSLCNALAVAVISCGLPLKEVKPVLDKKIVIDENRIRKGIIKNLNKEVHPNTKPSIDFIYKILEDAYHSKTVYDVSDMKTKVLSFAAGSSNNSSYCISLVNKMHFCSEASKDISYGKDYPTSEDDLVFFDCEVYPNLFLINWKYRGDGKNMVRMINPSPSDIEEFIKLKLVGFNCRRYDNHIIYAALLGYNNEQLFELSQKIVKGERDVFFREAYDLSYTDVYDFASAANKKGLKKFEIELGLHHMELPFSWDEPVPKSEWVRVSEYCDNDVIATEAVFEHLKGDWTARKIISKLSGLNVNATTNSHSAKIIFGDDRNPQSKFIYTDLREMFPGYKFDNGVSTYKGEEVGEGGLVRAKPGVYYNVGLLDIESMHPTSVEELNLFGDKYTKMFSELKKARLYIKHKEYDKLDSIMNGKLRDFIDEISDGTISAKDLSNALKTVINSVYGLTSAKFDNPFRDNRNKDNIVAKRGALFMIDLKEALEEKGWEPIHIKTDSVKIADINDDKINFVKEFGKKYGYNFELEDIYDRMCLINDAVYIAHSQNDLKWHAVGAQFAHPYVFKTLFSNDSIEFPDLCEMKNVNTRMYLDFNEDSEDEHNYVFVGRTGSFCPVIPGSGGGKLLREKDGKYYSVTGTKDYRWKEAEVIKSGSLEEQIDYRYFDELVKDSVDAIEKYCPIQEFVNALPF